MVSRSECDRIVQDLLRSNEKISVLLGGKLDNGGSKIICRVCDAPEERNARAYITSEAEIVLCANRLRNEAEIQRALTHEAVHAFDFANNRCDFSTSDGTAYSEVRAAREAECAGFHLCDWFRKRCIKSNAINATANMFGRSAASNAVESVFTAAVADLQPESPQPPKT
jgi:hypothetical protein